MQVIVSLIENNWQVDTEYFWDVEYKAQHLILRSGPRKIVLDIKIENEEVFITGKMYYNGFLINMEPNKLDIGGKRVPGLTIIDAGVGVEYQIQFFDHPKRSNKANGTILELTMKVTFHSSWKNTNSFVLNL